MTRRLLIAAAMLAAAALPARAAEQSCAEEVGQERAEIYADQCLIVSPATHPPCNTENPCALIFEEIERGCALIREAGEDVPEFCDEQPEDEEEEEPEAPTQ